MNCTCKYCNRECIQCKKGKIQTSEHTTNWSRNLPNRLRWSTPAGKVLVGTVLLKTFWSEARRPVALDWHTLWPANSKCKKIPSDFYRPLEWDFSTMELSWIKSKGTIARHCVQIFLSFPFYFTSTFSSKSLFCMLPTGSDSQLESGKQCCCNRVLMMGSWWGATCPYTPLPALNFLQRNLEKRMLRRSNGKQWLHNI